MKKKSIPFNVPYIGREEASSAYGAVAASRIVGDGALGRKAELMLERMFAAKYALLTTSCTHALELALLSAGIGAGDEVICPSFTFVSTANAIVRQKARPVFVEVDESTLNMDVKDLKNKITKKTRAVIPVHYAGISCSMDEIMKLSKRNKIVVIEDAAHGIGAKYKNSYLGAIGDIGCFSFHASKNLVCGEGGAFLTSNDRILRNAEISREKGTNRSAYIRGEVDKYTWINEGSSYVLSDILAAILLIQLKKMKGITDKRRKIFYYYLNGLKTLEDKGRVMLPRVGPECRVNGHIFYLRLNSEKERNCAIRKLRQLGIESTFHFIPLHASPYGRKSLGYKNGDFPVTEKVSKTILRLPIYPGLSAGDLDYIIGAVSKAVI